MGRKHQIVFQADSEAQLLVFAPENYINFNLYDENASRLRIFEKPSASVRVKSLKSFAQL